VLGSHRRYLTYVLGTDLMQYLLLRDTMVRLASFHPQKEEICSENLVCHNPQVALKF